MIFLQHQRTGQRRYNRSMLWSEDWDDEKEEAPRKGLPGIVWWALFFGGGLISPEVCMPVVVVLWMVDELVCKTAIFPVKSSYAHRETVACRSPHLSIDDFLKSAFAIIKVEDISSLPLETGNRVSGSTLPISYALCTNWLWQEGTCLQRFVYLLR